MRAPKRSLIKEEDSKLKIRATTEMPELDREGKINLKTIDDVPDDAAEFLSQMTDEEKEALKDKTKKKKFRL